MKQLSLWLALFSCAVLASLLPESCTKENQKSLSRTSTLGVERTSTITPPADPAIVFCESLSSGRYNREIKVMNADGSNQTVIIQGTQATIWDEPSWSPNALNYVYTKGPQGLWIDSINLVNGKPTLIKEHQIPIILPQGSIYPEAPWWSPNGNLIAFAATESNSNYSSIYLISPSGGTASIAYTSPQGFFPSDFTWSPDGTKLAFIETDTLYNYNPIKLMVLDLSAGNTVTTVFSQNNTYNFSGPRWSHNINTNLIGFTNYTIFPSTGVFTVTPTANAVPSQVNISGSTAMASWSPDDSKLLFNNSTRGLSTYTFGVGTIQNIYQRPKGVFKVFGADWRRF